MSTKSMPPSTYGLWHVTTEGDCEGHTTKDLGIHAGYFDEIALRLAAKVYYSLKMSWVDPGKIKESPPATVTSVEVALDIESGTWEMKPEERANAIRTFLRGRNVSVEPGTYFASVKLHAGGSPEERAKKEREAKRAAALAKLTPDDRKALGLGSD